MSKNILTKPRLSQIVLAGIITLMRDTFHISQPQLPAQIGKYSFLSGKQKDRGYRYSFGLGIYSRRGKKYFIKHWEGKIKDMEYYNLVNEYFLADFVSKKLHEHKADKVLAPRVIEHIQTSRSLSIVYEYREGTSLLSSKQSERITILLRCYAMLQNLSRSLTPDERKLFTMRSAVFYFWGFQVLFLLVLFLNKNHVKILVRSYTEALRMFFLRGTPILSIAHRDLDATNIILSGNTIYLTDYESMAITFSGFDLVWLSLSPDIKKLPRSIRKILKKPENKFLRTYILFHLVLSANPIPELRERYFKRLTE